MHYIGIIGAMASEVEMIKANIEKPTTKDVAGISFVYGTVAERPVVVAQCGIGKVCAAMCTQAMIDNFDIACVINTGVAGGLYRELSVGDMVIATETVEHDFNVTALGYAQGNVADGATPKEEATRIFTDPHMASRFKIAADKVLTDTHYFEGPIVSGDLFVGDSKTKAQLIQNFGAYAAEMEGAAIARVASQNEVPFVVVRSISDLADNEANMTYEEFEKKAAVISSRIVLAMLEMEE